jgi:hypothetical protein
LVLVGFQGFPTMGLPTFCFSFLLRSRHPSLWCLEVDEMRYEQIIAAVTRTLVIRTVREIEAVRLFVRTVDFHLCNLRNCMGMPAYAYAAHASYPSWSSFDDSSGGITTGMTRCKHGNLQLQSVLVPTSCRTRFSRV